MREKLKELFELRNYYFEDPSTVDEKGLEEEVKKLNIKIPEFLKEKSNETRLFVCPDLEYEFPFVIEFSKNNLKKGMEIVYDVLKEYYTYSEFYDGYTNLCVEELLRLFLFIENIPIIRYFDSKDVELLNVRKLNLETR